MYLKFQEKDRVEKKLKVAFPEKITACPKDTDSYRAYAKWLRNRDGDTLVTYQSLQQHDTVVANLQSACRSTCNQSFYLDDLNDIGYQTLVTENGDYHIIDSPLIQFIKQAKPGDTLILHREQCHSEHVGYNSMLDAVRKLSDVEIPDGLRIITMIPQNNQRDFGPDFSSRFDVVTPLEMTFDTITTNQNISEQNLDNENSNNEVTIQLYDSDLWRSSLIGKLKFKGHTITYTHGHLIEALDNKCSEICFVNPPKTREWEVFYQQLLHRRSFEANGQSYHIPKIVEIRCESQAYQFGKKDFEINSFDEDNNRQWQAILNPQTVTQFLQGYHSDDKGDLHDLPGLLAANKNKTLPVLLTQDLAPGTWAQLYDLATEHNCQLSIIDATNAEYLINFVPDFPNQIITTNDEDYVVAQLYTEDSDALVFSVSEFTEVSDLLGTISFNKTDNTIQFPFEKGELVKQLQAGNHVVLKGNLSMACQSELATLFCDDPYLWENGKRVKVSGKLSIVTENEKTLSFVSQRRKKDYKQKDNLRFSQQQVLARNPEKDANVFKVQQQINPQDTTNYDRLNAEEFDRVRLEKITNQLETEPSLFMVGPTASGKSTLVMRQLFTQENVAGYMGLAKLKDWASDDSDQLKILFIDEANMLTAAQLDMLTGLYSPTSGILIDKKWYPLDENHKIVFAGNPLSYGGRALHPMWQRHVVSDVFGELPKWYVQERIVKPLSELLDLTDEERALIDIERLSPRDVQHAVLETAVKKDISNIEKIKTDLRQHGFIFTESRELILNTLVTQLNIRQKKLKHPELASQGKDAIIIEGDAGEGKSLIVEALLKSQGYVKASRTEKNGGDKIYYHLAASDFGDLEKLLTKAFHEGAVVIVDEINTYPERIERLLNTLLSGTDLNNRKPEKPGFTLLGTQNPEHSNNLKIKYTGRKKATLAFANRVNKIVCQSYDRAELTHIVTELGLQKDIAALLVDDYLMAFADAVVKNKPIIPTPRDLFKYVGKLQTQLGSIDFDVENDRFQFVSESLTESKQKRQRAVLSKSLETNLKKSTTKAATYSKDIDLNTAGIRRSSHQVNKYFKNNTKENIRHYRLNVQVSEDVKSHDIQSRSFINTNNASGDAEAMDGDHGFFDLVLTEQWQPLPSLTAYDEITHLQCDSDVQLGYSELTRLYYVRTTTQITDKKQRIEFAVRIKSGAKEKYEQLETPIESLDEIDVSFFNEFEFNEDGTLDERMSQAPLSLLKEFTKFEQAYLLRRFFLEEFRRGRISSTGDHYFDKINAIIEHRKGACRHRANAFFELARVLDIPAKLISNECHRFCEVQCEDSWMRVELGGYPSNIKINDLTVEVAPLETLQERGYFEQSVTHTNGFSDNPPGVIDVERAVAGKPFWRNTQLHYEVGNKKKPILITNPIRTEYTIKLYQDLLSSGFELFVWEDGKPVACQNSNDIFEHVDSTSIDIVELPGYKIVDYFEAMKLSHLSSKYEYIVELKKSNSPDPAAFDSLMQMIRSVPVQSVTIDNIKLPNDQLEQLLSNTKSAEHLQLSRVSTSSSEAWNQLSEFSNLKKMIIRSFSESSQLTYAALVNMLQTASELEYLSVWYSDIIDDGSVSNDNLQLHSLKMLHLYGKIVDNDKTINLLKNTPMLQELNLTTKEHDVIDLIDVSDIPQWNHLKKVFFSNVKFSSDSFKKVLRSTKLKKINLSNVSICEELSLSDQDVFNKINEVRLSKLRNTEVVKQFISRCPNLEELKLEECGDLEEIFSETNLEQLSTIKYLELNDSDVSESMLITILKACTNLEQLQLRCELSDAFILDNIQLFAGLETLGLESIIQYSTTQRLFSACVNLKEIYYEGLMTEVLRSDIRVSSSLKCC